jgi:tRNA1Val (adenine37-N6)-methyltransferase
MKEKTANKIAPPRDFSLLEGEKAEILNRDGLRLIQRKGLPKYTLDTLLLADFALKTLEKNMPLKIGDWGSGSGLIALLLAGALPLCRVKALELMDEMAALAQRNVLLNDMGNRIAIIKGDIRRSENYFDDDFDAIVCNPPYMPKGKGNISPDLLRAAAKSEIYCTLEDIIISASRHLRKGGILFLCLRPQRESDWRALCAETGLFPALKRLVYSRAPRPPRHILLAAIKGCAEEKEARPLIIFEDEGVYSAEAKGLYPLFYPDLPRNNEMEGQ